MAFYADSHRQFQDRHETRALADRLRQFIVHDTFTPEDAGFIAAREFFFLSTIDPTGHPTVSFKGGAPGFVSVIDNALVFPCFDGNGMFLSMGNMAADPRVALLFIDFETPRRLRVQGTAVVDVAGIDAYPGALAVVRIRPQQIFVNCGRYIPRYAKVQASPHVPDTNGSAPLPQWKRLDVLQDVMPDADRQRVAEVGTIDLAQAQADAAAGRA